MPKTIEALADKMRAMGSSTAAQILMAMNADYPSSPYILEEIEGQLEVLVAQEPDEFFKAGDLYAPRRKYRVRVGS